MLVKIKTFDELDIVLENSFSAVRKEIRQVKKNLDEKDIKNTQSFTKLVSRQAAVDTDVKSLKSSLKEEVKREMSSVSQQADKKIESLKTSIDKKSKEFEKKVESKSASEQKKQELWKSDINKRFEDLKSNVHDQKVSDAKRFELFASEVQKEVEDEKKQRLSDRGISNAKTDTLSKELKQLKSELLNSERAQMEKVNLIREDVAKASRQSNKYADTKFLEVDSNLENVKKDIVKLMATLRDKLVSKESFDKRNQMIETMLRESLDQTKDLDKAKLSYYARNSFSTQLDEVKATLNGEVQQLASARKDLDRLSEQLSSKVAYSDIQKLNVNLDEQTQKLASLHDKIDSVAIKTPTKLELSTVEESLRTATNKIDTSFTLHEQDIERMKDDMGELKMWRRELHDLKESLEKTEQKTLENSSRIDVILASTPKPQIHLQELTRVEEPIEVTTSSPQLEKTNLVAEVEEMLEEKEKQEVVQKEGFFTRFKKGLIDFFFEEEVQPAMENKEHTVEPTLELSPPLPLKEEEQVREINNWEEETTKEIMGEEKPKTPKKSKKIEQIPPEDSKSRKKKYKTQEKGEEGQEEMYYPEDYFY